MSYHSWMIKPFSTTGIGSLPHNNPTEACRLIFDIFDIPFWPQLPKRSFRELMIPQYSEGMPDFRMDLNRQTFWIERGGTDELERFYEGYSETSKIAISEDYAAGLHEFLRLIKGKKYEYLKGHVTGPLTFTLGLRDNRGKTIFFDEELREISLMLLKAKIRWQVDALKNNADQVIIFIDEPIMSALGSSTYIGVSSKETLRLLKEASDAIKDAGGIPGIHCCGNADWPLILESGVDILNFDAYDYINTIGLYPDEIRRFLENGGYLAWGIIPTSDVIGDITPESIKRHFENGITLLSRDIPRELLLSRIMLTPSCGTGSRSVDETMKIFQFIIRLKEDFT